MPWRELAKTRRQRDSGQYSPAMRTDPVSFHGLPGSVDRRMFIPDNVYKRQDGAWVPLSRDESPREWAELVLSDHSVTTAVDAEGRPVAASSVPSMMATMITLLDVKPGMRVLEIGTGTGYGSACLATLGADVTTIEVDEEMAARARKNLKSACYPGVRVIAGDGALGSPDHAPYDRIISTAAIRKVPYTWVEQARDGGLLVIPFTSTEHKGGLLVLRANDGTAEGEVGETAFFMPLTGHEFGGEEFKALPINTGLRVKITSDGQTTFLPGT